MENFNDVSDAFDGWLQAISGTRPSGSYVGGRWVASASATLTFFGVVQNATPDDLKVLPEGNRTDEAIKIHTIFGLEPKTDIISYRGKNWLVHNVAKRYIGNYHKAIAIRQ